MRTSGQTDARRGDGDAVPPRRSHPGVPPGILAASDYEALACRHLPAPTLAWLEGGSGDEVTLADNRRAFAEWAVTPRVLDPPSSVDTTVHLLGHALPAPVLLAPVALQQLVHPQGERETARGADAADTCIVCSTLSSMPLEDIARATGAGCWFQLYLQPRRADSLALVRRAEAAGCRALVLTVDAAVQAPGRRALRAGFRVPADVLPGNFRGRPAPAPASLADLLAAAPRWADLEWLLDATRLPVLVKGVLHPQDARHVLAAGAAGVIVSNHGGRGLDGAPASLRALPAVRDAVGGDGPVLLDGGVRAGLDVFKAIALGADAVLVGRLQVQALAVAGALGVAHMLRLLREELSLCMAQAGCADTGAVRDATLHGLAGIDAPC